MQYHIHCLFYCFPWTLSFSLSLSHFPQKNHWGKMESLLLRTTTDNLWERVTLKLSQSCSQFAVGRQLPSPAAVTDPMARLSMCPRPPRQGMVLHIWLVMQSHAIDPKTFLWKRLQSCTSAQCAVQPRFSSFVHYQRKKCYSGFSERGGCFELLIQWWKIFCQLEVTICFHSDNKFLKIFIQRYYIILDSCLEKPWVITSLV